VLKVPAHFKLFCGIYPLKVSLLTVRSVIFLYLFPFYSILRWFAAYKYWCLCHWHCYVFFWDAVDPCVVSSFRWHTYMVNFLYYTLISLKGTTMEFIKHNAL